MCAQSIQRTSKHRPTTDTDNCRSSVSIVIPAKNEAASLRSLLLKLKSEFPSAELLVINDGSTDNTLKISEQHGARVVSHPYSVGNGAAVKTGARAAKGQYIVCLDADGQHDPSDVEDLLSKLNEGYDMVVGARNAGGQAGRRRTLGNYLYNRFASLITGHKIEDLTSGFRAVKAAKFKEFLYLLPNGFSYPTTITMAFFRSGYSVAYVPIEVDHRVGNSHLRLAKDGIRFLLIIFKVGTLYSPLKVFVPTSAFFFASGLTYYLYTYLTQGRFTNMGMLLFITAIIVFLIGLVSEQITTLMYSHNRGDNE